MTQTDITVTRTIDAPADRVWDALTSPEQRFFLGARVDSDYRVGSPITFSGEMEGKAYRDKGEILEAEAGRRLSFSHYNPSSGEDTPRNYHRVTFDLAPHGDATKVTLTQAPLTGEPKASDAKLKDKYEETWGKVLDGLSRSAGH